jgi:tRNA-dihydrouridine synthase 1
MVGASDLAFRLLCRAHGADTCYTEMIFGARFMDDPLYRERMLQTCPQDRPLVVQFCTNEPSVLAGCAKLVHEALPGPDVAVDLNLGCPLPQAKEQDFGAYLLRRSNWPNLATMVEQASRASPLPVFVKIRLCDTVDDTVELCQCLQTAGCQLIAVHGRRVDERSSRTSWERGTWVAADLAAVCTVAAALEIPVLANGNTSSLLDVRSHLREANVAGVMSAEGLLRNPALFEIDRELAHAHELGALALEYLGLAATFPPRSVGVVRSHLMWMMGKSEKGRGCTFDYPGAYTSQQLHAALLAAETLEEFETIVRGSLLHQP